MVGGRRGGAHRRHPRRLIPSTGPAGSVAQLIRAGRVGAGCCRWGLPACVVPELLQNPGVLGVTGCRCSVLQELGRVCGGHNGSVAQLSRGGAGRCGVLSEVSVPACVVPELLQNAPSGVPRGAGGRFCRSSGTDAGWAQRGRHVSAGTGRVGAGCCRRGRFGLRRARTPAERARSGAPGCRWSLLQEFRHGCGVGATGSARLSRHRPGWCGVLSAGPVRAASCPNSCRTRPLGCPGVPVVAFAGVQARMRGGHSGVGTSQPAPAGSVRGAVGGVGSGCVVPELLQNAPSGGSPGHRPPVLQEFGHGEFGRREVGGVRMRLSRARRTVAWPCREEE
ncbi:hypothetical protein QE377_001216 [Microbacterium sp. SORGH_AS 862]|nr:hypothetical protein [Microbacterium sp. SORGH_AS_0862]